VGEGDGMCAVPAVAGYADGDGVVGVGAQLGQEGGHFGPGDGESIGVEEGDECRGGAEAVVAVLELACMRRGDGEEMEWRWRGGRGCRRHTASRCWRRDLCWIVLERRPRAIRVLLTLCFYFQ